MIEHKLLDIFGGRMDSYGLDVPKDADPAGGGKRVDRLLTAQLVKQHLEGGIGIGVYPTWHDAEGNLMTAWGCCDIDTGDWSEAWGLVTALRAMGMVPHVERSRSKGWHVWVFAAKPVPAWQMRRALKVAYAAIELPAKEANPKSEQLEVGQVGNYVRLPYKGALSQDGYAVDAKQCFMKLYNQHNDGVPFLMSDWLFEFDSSCETQPEVIENWARRYQEPKRAAVRVATYTDEEIKALCSGLRGDLLLFVRNGPKADRSAGMVALAHKLRAAGYTTQEAFNLLVVADSQWGNKYGSRGEAAREKYLTDILERAYA